MLYADIQNCASSVGGEHTFQNNYDTSRQKIEKWSRMTLDSRFDDYMRGLVGPKSEHVDLSLASVCFSEGSRADGGFQENIKAERPDPSGRGHGRG